MCWLYGAGPYPQSYFSPMSSLSTLKKLQQRNSLYLIVCFIILNIFKPLRTLPFVVSMYFQVHYQDLINIVAILTRCPCRERPRFIVLDDSYSSTYCLDSDEVSNPRLSKYSILMTIYRPIFLRLGNLH